MNFFYLVCLIYWIVHPIGIFSKDPFVLHSIEILASIQTFLTQSFVFSTVQPNKPKSYKIFYSCAFRIL